MQWLPWFDIDIWCSNISDIAIITVKNADCPGIIYDINKSEAIDLLENYVLQYLYINEHEGKKHLMVNDFIPDKV